MIVSTNNLSDGYSGEIVQEYSLQNAIRTGDLASLEISISTIDLSNKLPNGELPVHFAVREGQAETVRFLVEQGANPMEKDFQGLTAVDHAFLQKNNEVLLSLLGPTVAEQFAAGNSEQNSKATGAVLKDIEKTVNEITSGKTTQSCSAMQQAVFAGDYHRLKELLEEGEDIQDIMIPQNLNLLHLAAMGSSPDVVDLLVQHGVDLTATDKSGRTAAHYAAINPNGTALGRLTKLGADLSKKDDGGVSSLALLGASAQLRDPLNLTKAHALMFVATVIQTAATIGIQSGLIGEEHQLTAAYVLLGGVAIAGYSEFAVQLQNIDKTWKKALAWIGVLGFGALPIVGTSLSLWRTYSVARSAFEGIQASYNNARYRTWKATRNAVIYTANAGTTVSNLWARVKLDYEMCLNGYHYYKMYAASTQDERIEAYEEYLRFLRERYGFAFDSENIGTVNHVGPSDLEGLTTLERLNKEELNPQHLEHALMMVDPGFTKDQLQTQGKALYIEAYRDMMLELHPDKTSDKDVESASVRLVTAGDTLRKWVRDHK